MNNLQREFFKNHISLLTGSKKGIIIDTTAMPNQIHFPFNAWGYHDSEIDKQVKLLFVIDRSSSLPLYFRYLPGNVVDVSSLNVTVEELRKFGVESSFAKSSICQTKKSKSVCNEAYAHIILGPERKGRETKKLLIVNGGQKFPTFGGIKFPS